MSSPILVASKISKVFHTPEKTISVFQDISLEIFPGDKVAIIGASGQGKSTLLQILGTLDTPTTGEVTIDGQIAAPSNYAELRLYKIGFMFQAFYLLDDYSLMDNILMPAKIARLPTDENSLAFQWMKKFLKETGLWERRFFSAKLLSGGEKQRIALARALCNHPKLLIADEPTGSLDNITAQKLFSIMKDWSEKQQGGLLIATHDLHLAQQCDKIYQLSEGKLELLSNPF